MTRRFTCSIAVGVLSMLTAAGAQAPATSPARFADRPVTEGREMMRSIDTALRTTLPTDDTLRIVEAGIAEPDAAVKRLAAASLSGLLNPAGTPARSPYAASILAAVRRL